MAQATAPSSTLPTDSFIIQDWQVGTSMTEKNHDRKFIKSRTIPDFFFWLDQWESGTLDAEVNPRSIDQFRADVLDTYERAQKNHARSKMTKLQAFYAANGVSQ